MFKISGIKFILISLLLLPLCSNAQLDEVPINLPKYDKRKIHFGFALGFNSANFVVDRVGNFKVSDTIYTVESNAISGLNLGILANLRLGEYFDFRFIPTLAFNQRNLYYHFIYYDTIQSESFITKNVESTYLEFPFLIKFKSARKDNYRVYVIAGMKYGIDMVSQAKVKSKEKDVVKLIRNDYGYEIGIGFDFYLSYFKFSPEIKMYNGLKNLLLKENTQFVNPIDALYAKTFVVSLLFE